jgi:hypothetical protein
MKAELDALLPPLHRPVEGRAGERRILFRWRFMKRRLPRVGFRTS